MTPLTFTGTLRQSDAEALRQKALAQLADGGLVIEAADLTAIEVGPLQVLLAAAVQARQKGLPCRLDERAAPAFDAALAAVRLPEVATFFTLVPAAEMTVTP